MSDMTFYFGIGYLFRGKEMRLYGNESNEIVMKELGQRIQDIRIAMNLTQAQMADRSGVGLRTVARIENGEGVKVESVLNILRVLGILGNLNELIQEQVLAPTQIIDIGKKRKRVTATKKKREKSTWVWGDEK